MKEETREHRVLETFALLPPKATSASNRRRPRGGNFSPGLPTVVVDVHTDKRRKHAGGCLKRYLKLIFIIGGIFLLADVAYDYYFVGGNGEPSPPIIQRDYSLIQSVEDLVPFDESTIQQKCFHKRTSCPCLDPTIPIGRLDSQQWARIHHFNKETVEKNLDVDVVFLGDSITEGWTGMSFGRTSQKVHDVPQVFSSLFSMEQGAEFEGIALGIAGDSSPNLLWRIQNGELPDDLQPSFIWVLIGTNDLGNTWCSAEMVLIGIIRVVEELRIRKPAATIIVNGILPRTYNRNGYVGRGRSRKWWKKKSPPAMPSMWDDIEAINEELKSYASSRAKVEYFETQSFFVDNTASEENLQIDGKLMPDYLHPSAEGYQLWGQEIVDKLKTILPKR